MEVFETQELDSDEQEDDSPVGSDEDGEQEKKVKAPKVKKEPIQTDNAGNGEEKPDYGHLI